MLDKIFQAIQRHDLLPAESHVLVGVSGGADSVALVHALHYLQASHPFAMTVAHLHHGIRGADADEDESFVQVLAWKLGAPCVHERAEVPALARRRGISLEMAAREARREFFRRAAVAVGADRVATAHTADDQVETFLLRVLRGAGVQGLGGMAPLADWRGLAQIRPLLDVTHTEIEEFLLAHGLPWREDATNRDPLILRNRVRHQLLPYLQEEFQPGIRGVLLRTAAVLRDENAWLESLARRALERCRGRAHPERLVVARLAREPAAARRRILIDWLRLSGYDPARIDFNAIARLDRLAAPRIFGFSQLAKSVVATPGRGRGRSAVLAGGWRVDEVYGELIVRHTRAHGGIKAFQVRLPVPGEVTLAGQGLCVRAEPWRGIVRPARGKVGQLPAEATVSAERVAGAELVVRTWRPGDRIQPWGLQGTVKLQDLFVDQKVPRAGRAGLPVFECAGEIIWVPGYRVARAWAVPSPSGASIRLSVAYAD